MERINLNRKELISKIEKNLNLHKKIYDETMVAFKKKYLEKLSKMTAEGNNDIFTLTLDLEKPEDHSQDYKNALEMIKMDCREVVILSEIEFLRYVLNRWSWIQRFKHSYVSNITGYSGSQGSTGSHGFSGYSGDAKEYFDGTDEE